MVTCNNNGQRRFPALVVLIVAGIMIFAAAPCRVFAAGSTDPPADSMADEVASFDEDEAATFESESTENASSLFHAAHYHSPTYDPGRQARSVTSHRWVRALPFAALVVLAVVTIRFHKRRKHQGGYAPSTAALGKITNTGIWIVVGLAISAGISNALVYSPVKDAVVSFLGEDQKIYQTAIEITPDARQMFEEKLGWAPQAESVKAYYSRNPAGAIDGYAFVLSDRLPLCGGVHKYCIKVSPEGQVEGVKILELTCDRSYAINTRAFLNQFKKFNSSNADSLGCDAVSGATLSTELTHNVVRRALALFELLAVQGET